MYVARRRGPTLFGVLASLLVTLLLVMLVLGWWRNWFSVSSRNADQQVELGLTINKDEVERDLGKLQDETERVADTAQVAAGLTTLEGTVTAISATQLTLRADQQEHALALDDVTEFYLEDQKTEAGTIQQGDSVRVTFQETDGQKRASRVTELTTAPPT